MLIINPFVRVLRFLNKSFLRLCTITQYRAFLLSTTDNEKYKMTQRIKTNIKFYKGLDNVEDKLYGFVTKSNGSWRGCREDENKKKIVLVDSSIAQTIVPNVLYSCSLIPMRKDEGFIVKSASLIKFKGIISTTCRNNIFLVSIKFGNKIIIYNPASKERRKRDIKTVADNLRNRVDLENAQEVAEEFISTACLIKRLYEQSLQNV